jgi:hypothetical protein
MAGGSSPSRVVNEARAAVDDAASWVTQHCTDEELAMLEAARHQLLTEATSQDDRLHREADLLMRWSASLAMDEAQFLERI